jgi:hypothetical protein
MIVEHNNNPFAMVILFIVFSVNMAISLASATEIIRLCAAIAALVPAIGGAFIWLKNNKHFFIKKKE